MFLSSHNFPKIYLLGGLTGSGKTELLHHLFRAGEQVLNLETLCCHDGSAFARLQYAHQPTSYQFNKQLNKTWRTFNNNKPVFIEQELQRIGNISVPDWLYKHMVVAPIIFLDTEKSIRIQRLSQLIRKSDPFIFCECLQKLSDRLPRNTIGSVLENFSTGRIEDAVELLLEYYDNSNGYATQTERVVLNLHVNRLDIQFYCQAVCDITYASLARDVYLPHVI
ncbi:MAG: hypothetical protein ACTHLE_09170 [Agriterribacter sp.]